MPPPRSCTTSWRTTLGALHALLIAEGSR